MDVPQETFKSTEFGEGGFWHRKRKIIYDVTIPYQLKALKDTGRYDAFKLQWHPSYSDPPDHWPVPNHLFWDSDVGKWLEGACYFLEDNSFTNDEQSRTIKTAVEELVAMIREAQHPDGYINIHFTVVDPKGRWTNVRDLHELYNAGHLIEGALAHEGLTGEKEFLDCMIKYTDLISCTFGPASDQKHGYPGHPEIELALLRLYRRTRDPKHLQLARYFLTERGNLQGHEGRHYYDVEAEERGDRSYERPGYYPQPKSYWYQQAHKPIRDQRTIEGHSVRAMYLLTAVADLVCLSPESKDSELDALHVALQALWRNMVDRKMYLTGGIGSIKQWEGFSLDYFLPQSTDEGGCYAETCASIGVLMLAERMSKLDLDGQYADVLELCLYNATLGGISLDGKAFTYENQLASSDAQPSTRHEWFTCACCPPNVCRVLGYLGGYFWSVVRSDHIQIAVHLYDQATLKLGADMNFIELKQSSNWPWNGEISFNLRNPSPEKVTIKLRIPRYVSHWTLSPSNEKSFVTKGYLTLDADYLQRNPDFKLTLSMAPRFVRPHPYTNQNVVAIARGPIIYCLEDADNPWVKDHFKSLRIDPEQVLDNIVESYDVGTFEGETFVALKIPDGPCFIDFLPQDDTLPYHGASMNGHASKPHQPPQALNFIPYYLRANRGGNGQMRVGVRVK